MPRVHTAVKSKRGLEHRCSHCRNVIEDGQVYYWWKQYGAPKRFRHVLCGFPRHSELSNAKTAPLLDAVEDAGQAFSDWGVDVEFVAAEGDEAAHFTTDDNSASGLAEILEGLAEEARSIAEEYEEGADNMPENLQDGYQANAMREVADALNEWADGLDGFTPEGDVDWPKLPDGFGPDHPDYDAIFEKAREAAEAWAKDMRDNADDMLTAEEVPEYEG